MKNNLTDTELLGKFADFLAARWLSGYHHHYEITTHPAWHAWRARHAGLSPRWSCSSLSEAAANWCWTSPVDSFPFGDLANALQQAIACNNQALALDLCLQIFKWGGVARRPHDASRVWVIREAAAERLTTNLAAAVALLLPEEVASLERFNLSDLLMNSATTKLYAAAATNGQVAIYDGRVGAALGLLARQFLEEQDIDSVPECLLFSWGPPQSPAQVAARTRDPSSVRYAFKQLPNGARSHLPRARLSRLTNKLFDEVCKRLAATGSVASFLDLERALFMIGYRVR